MLTSAPFDDWWHKVYGFDVKIISPAHLLMQEPDAVAIPLASPRAGAYHLSVQVKRSRTVLTAAFDASVP